MKPNDLPVLVLSLVLALFTEHAHAAQPNPKDDSILQTKKTKDVPSFHVCGNYCGPGWCNGKYIEEIHCDTSVPPQVDKLGNVSCADACCKAHDHCCGHEPPYTQCNTQIVDCLDKCAHFSMSCSLDGVGVPAGVVEAAMDIVEDWCCGGPCK